MEYFLVRNVLSEFEVSKQNLMKAEYIELSTEVHKVIDMSVVRLQYLAVDNFRSKQVLELWDLPLIVNAYFEEQLLTRVIPIEVVFLFQLSVENHWKFVLVGFLVQVLY